MWGDSSDVRRVYIVCVGCVCVCGGSGVCGVIVAICGLIVAM